MTRALLIAAVVALATWPGAAPAQDLEDPLLEGYRRPGQFYLDGPMRKMVAHVKSAKHFRICVAKGKPNVPIVVEYDEHETTVAPGDCFDFEAAKVWVKPGKSLSPKAVAEDYVISGTLQRVH